jgi:hypothetical protein
MASVTFDTVVGGDGSTVTDDDNPSTGLGNGGNLIRLIPMMAQVVAVANTVVTIGGGMTQDVIDAESAANNSASSALTAQSAAAAAGTLLANTGSMLGINFGSFTVVDGELTVSHLSSVVPSLVNGDLVITYETL